MEKLLEKHYYDPSGSGSFGGINKLYHAVKKVPLSEVKKWLSSQRTYTLHRPVIRNFPRNKIVAYDKDEIWNADLVFMDNYGAENDRYKYILTIIDVLSKYAWGIPLKDKSPLGVMSAFDKVFKVRKCKF